MSRQNGRKYLGYRRVSRVGERGERLRSLDFQAHDIEAAARREHVEIEMLPPEVDVSGSKESRVVLDEAIRRVQRGEVAGIIVARLDRLSRMPT